MAVRNFYIKGQIDGRSTLLAGGPANKLGGMGLTLFQRDEGSIAIAFEIECFVANDGRLVTVVADKDGKTIGKFVTER